jgi:hypothetical protein
MCQRCFKKLDDSKATASKALISRRCEAFTPHSGLTVDARSISAFETSAIHISSHVHKFMDSLAIKYFNSLETVP